MPQNDLYKVYIFCSLFRLNIPLGTKMPQLYPWVRTEDLLFHFYLLLDRGVIHTSIRIPFNKKQKSLNTPSGSEEVAYFMFIIISPVNERRVPFTPTVFLLEFLIHDWILCP